MKINGWSMIAAFATMLAVGYADEPKSYRVTLPSSTIGSAPFSQGDYKVLVHRDEPKIGLLSLKGGNVIEVKGKVQDVDKKFDRTEIYTTETNGVKQVSEIHIGGTKFSIDFRP